jgi:hypothetical protein
MLNYYGYLYSQAEYDFKRAVSLDPGCGMCYWGLAISKKHQALELGQPFGMIGYDDVNTALQLIHPDHQFQYDLIQATLNSFSLETGIPSSILQLKYINALRDLNHKYQNDKIWREESLALFVDAIAYYANVDDNFSHQCGVNVNEALREEAVNLLTVALNDASYRDHPGLIHTYIHMTERNLQDRLGLIAAKKLPKFSNGEIAHYTHMPNHIYWRRGLYDQAIRTNLDTVAIDQKYFNRGGAGLTTYYYEYHYLHSYHFLSVLGVLTDDFNLAVDNARAVKRLMHVDRLEGLKDYRDTFFSLEHLVLARFSRWQDVVKLEVPLQTNELGVLLIRFSKALAYLNLNQVKRFEKLYNQIKDIKYNRANMINFQKLVVTYLQVSEMGMKGKSLSDLEHQYLENQVDQIEKNMFGQNPPIWFFPYDLLLSDIAYDRNDMQSARYYHQLFEEKYPRSTLGKWKE